jgi:hypothetical protein
VREALVKAGREDLIGFDKKCLIRPRKSSNAKAFTGYAGKTGKNNSNSDAHKPSKKKTIRNIHSKKRV